MPSAHCARPPPWRRRFHDLLHFGRALGDAGQPEESKAVLDRFRNWALPGAPYCPPAWWII